MSSFDTSPQASRLLRIDRRRLIGGAAAAAAAGSMAGLASSRAASASGAAGVHRLKIGAADITVLTDGTMAMPLGFVLPGRERSEVAAVFKGQGKELGETTLQVNVTIIRHGSDLIMIDCGAGPDFAPARGKLVDNLARAGIAPDAITKVVFTHAHADHLWGVSDPFDGGSIFPKARHFMTATERDYWLSADTETRVPAAMKGVAIGTRRRLQQLGDTIETVKPGAEIVPGLAMVDSAGHSPGHASVLLRSGSAQMLIGGDVLTEAVISFAKPDWRWGADWDGDKGIAARRRVLGMLSSDKIALLGYHLPWPGLGRVERVGTAYRFVAQ